MIEYEWRIWNTFQPVKNDKGETELQRIGPLVCGVFVYENEDECPVPNTIFQDYCTDYDDGILKIIGATNEHSGN